MKVKKDNISTTAGKPKKNLMVIIGSGLGIVVLGVIILFIAKSSLATTDYYVLKNPEPANTQINPDMLEAQSTSAGTQPKNALDINQVQSGQVYTKYALDRGDVLSNSNAGANNNSVSGIPDSWVTTSFAVADADAVGGNIQKGNYFDIIGIDNSSKARYLFTDVLALNVSSNSAVNNGQKSAGSSSSYTVGMPAKDIALLHSALKKYPNIKLVQSPKSVAYGQRSLQGLGNSVSYSNDGPTNQDLYKGTDPTFSQVKRNSKGEPTNQKANPALQTPSNNE